MWDSIPAQMIKKDELFRIIGQKITFKATDHPTIEPMKNLATIPVTFNRGDKWVERTLKFNVNALVQVYND